jgi:hypothetical protein
VVRSQRLNLSHLLPLAVAAMLRHDAPRDLRSMSFSESKALSD